MTERITNGFTRIFEIRLLHHYWLDEGSTVFDLMPTQKQRDARLLSYDMRSFFSLSPTAATAKTFRGLGAVVKETALGIVVAAPGNSEIPTDAMFAFTVTVQNRAVLNYTALTLRPQRIREFYHLPEKKAYRFKENVPVLSNLTGAWRGAGPEKALFLSREIPEIADDDPVESLVLSGNALFQLTGDQPGAGKQQLSALATDLPVFVHQGDVPHAAPPAGLAGVPARGIMLSDDIPDNVFALIRLSAVRDDDGDFSIVDSFGHAKISHPVFQVRFKNRATIWKYFEKSTGAASATELIPLPLTRFGNAGTKQKPSEGLVKAVKSGNKITQLVSEIFV